ncbi:S-layer homology domain-containing protein [uncultured Succiniclasticum sp.]|uniref:S-layer homology domain-containing protein n=1 Tax=uncultured Succiniclasticum sp. TaxID=1500547 RepID=UPI0025CC5A2B|nr:S-layer homology domain-containing protein [uncultured Succiniclasticum sp.]
MKKSLVLAMAMALGVTASAYAANPFSDVPAGHWAYDSISKLAAAGVIEGYGDDTFRGDRLMTRYEMAQIVARAMAKGANVDKLAAEFADELDKLNVRVAALEKKSDNVKITGAIRYHYKYSKRNRDGLDSNKSHENALRTRLYFNGKVNDNWKYVGRIQNEQWFHDDETPEVNHVGEDGDTRFNIAKLEGRLGGVKVIAGRDDDIFADGYIFDGEYDAVKLSYGEKWYVTGAYGKLTDINEDGPIYSKKFWNAEIGSNIDGSFVNGKVGYLKTTLGDNAKADYDNNGNVGILYVGANFNVAKDLTLDAMYLHSNRDKFKGAESKKGGYVFGLGYKGAEASEPGSWGLAAKYYHQGRGTYLAHTIDGDTDFNSGFKGWSFGGDVTLAKNMVLSATYYDTKALKGDQDDNAKTKVLWTEFNVYF